MAAGADKGIFYDPPGAIGLVDRDAVLTLRFNEAEADELPQDEGLACNDFDGTIDTTAMPDLGDGVLGRCRIFDGLTTGIAAKDKVAGATLETRDVSIQVVLLWDIAAQNAAGHPGTIIARGRGGSAVEYVCYGIRLDVVTPGSYLGLLRWFWQDTSGAMHLDAGALVVIPPGAFTMLTATRRWVSPTQVELRYYVGDVLLGSVSSASGSIGGGTTGTVQIGYRHGATEFLAGAIDEIMLLDRELCAEEIEATYLRLVRYQPLGIRLMRESVDPGFPISEEPSSDAQLEIRMKGMALGFAASRLENVRANSLPQRAYGQVLADWEEAVRPTPQPAQSIEQRRARVIARLSQRRGCSIDGTKDVLRELVDCDADALQFLAYDNTVRDGFDSIIDPLLWSLVPAACATWNAGRARFAPAAGNHSLTASARNWLIAAQPASQPGRPTDAFGGEHVMAKLVLTTPQNNCEAGVFFGDRASGNYLLLGLRQDGTFKVATESFQGFVSQGVVVQAALGANPAAIWLHLHERIDVGGWIPSWSVTGASAGFASGAAIMHPSKVFHAGIYFRSNPTIAGAAVADFDDFALRTPNGTRPYSAYVLRDPGLGGRPDLEAAHSAIQAIKHDFVDATIIESKQFLLGPGGGRHGRGPMGGS